MLKWLDTVRGSIFVDWESPDFEDARNESDDRRIEQSTIRTEFSNAQKSEVSRFRDGSELYETETEGSAWDISNNRSTIRWSAEFVANTTDTSILFRRRDTLRGMSSIRQIIYDDTKVRRDEIRKTTRRNQFIYWRVNQVYSEWFRSDVGTTTSHTGP